MSSSAITIFSSGKWVWFLTFEILKQMKPILLLLFDKMPEPTKENTHFENTHRIIERRDWFFSHLIDESKGRVIYKVMRALWNLVIIKYDYDSDYKFFADVTKEEFDKIPWEPRNKKIGLCPHWRYFDD